MNSTINSLTTDSKGLPESWRRLVWTYGGLNAVNVNV
jgi:hypothetical protein